MDVGTMLDNLSKGSPVLLALVIVLLITGQIIPKVLHDMVITGLREQLAEKERVCAEWKEQTRESTKLIGQLTHRLEEWMARGGPR